MAQFAVDTFTEGSNTTLASHTPGLGGSWVLHPASTSTITVWSATGDASHPAGDTTMGQYYIGSDPGNNEQIVEADFIWRSNVSGSMCGLAARLDTAEDYRYFGYYLRSSQTWNIQRKDADGTVAATPGDASGWTSGTVHVKLDCSGAIKRLYVDDVEVCSLDDDNLTAVGKVGLRSLKSGSGIGIHIDNFTASNSIVAVVLDSATVQTDGNTLRCVWRITTGAGWGTVTVDADTVVDLTIGSETVRGASFGTPTKSTTTNADDTLTMDIVLGGYIYTDESGVTIDIPAGLVNDGTYNNEAEDDTAVTNNSTTDNPSALSRQVAHPIFLWAVMDKLPWLGDTARVAIAGGDNFAGTEKVTFEFFENDGTTPINVTVGIVSDDTHEASQSTWADLRGRGVEGEYWLVDVLTSSLPSWSSASNDVVVKATATLNDGQTYEVPWTYILRKWPDSPNLIYVNLNAADDTGAGTSGDPKKSIDGALTIANDNTDGIVFQAAGTYACTGGTDDPWWTSDTRDKFLRWHLDDGLSKGDVIVDPSGRINFGEHQWVDSIQFDVGDGLFCRTRDYGTESTHIVIDNCDVNFTSINHPSFDESPVILEGQYCAFINYYQYSGFRGIILAGIRSIVQGYTIDNSNTGGRNVSYQLWEQFTLLRARTDPDYDEHPSAPVHSDGIHYDSPSSHNPVLNNIIRYGRMVDSNFAIGILHNYGSRNLLIAFILYWNDGDKAVMQLEADVEDSFNNIQLINNTCMQKGNTDDDAIRGITFPTNVHDTAFDGMDNCCYVNNVTNNGISVSSVLGARRLAGNQNDTGYSWAMFQDADTGDYENSSMWPGEGSPLLASAVATDFSFDLDGNALANDGTDAIGALQTGEEAASTGGPGLLNSPFRF